VKDRISFLALVSVVAQVSAIVLIGRASDESAEVEIAPLAAVELRETETIGPDRESWPFDSTPAGRDLAAALAKNPIQATQAAIGRGERVYRNFCASCHGEDALGFGPVAERAPLGMSLRGQSTRNRADGALFHIVTYGRLTMPPHGDLVSIDDRWRVIHYLRSLPETSP
jgi:mono/diheme cytochrome c family protein